MKSTNSSRALTKAQRHVVKGTLTHPNAKLLAVCVAAAMAQFAAQNAFADSGHGVDTVIGNSQNQSPPDTPKDPDGLGVQENSRTPTGFRHLPPSELRTPGKSSGGWLYSGSIDAGITNLGGDTNNAKFREYKDLRSGFTINNFGLKGEKLGTASFYELYGGGIGRNDQYFNLQFGTYNDWKVKAYYNETPHVFTSTYRDLWNGTGSGTLTLRSLTPGGVTSAANTDILIGNAALATPYSTLSLVRKKLGVQGEFNISGAWTGYIGYSVENRQGARPFGMVSGGGGGTGGVEVPESIDYKTHDFTGGLRFNNERSSLNLSANVSLFRNNIGTMTVANPMFLAAANGITSFPNAVYDLYPNNNYYNLKAEYARSMPDFYRGRFTGVVSLSSSQQNDDLIPSTSYAGATVNGVAGGQWNTINSLSKTTAGARIDTRLIDLGLSLSPTNKLDLRAKLRHHETANSTEYWACNPLTGQWGRLINDGSGAVFATPNVAAGNNPAGTLATAYDSTRCNVTALRTLGLVPSAGNVNIRNIPYEYKQTVLSFGGDYRLNRNNSFSASIEREEINRTNRERAQTFENRLKLGYVNRSFESGSLRLSFETSARGGSTYVSDPYDPFYSASFGGTPTATGTNMTSWIHVNDLHRKFDLADRKQNILNARFNTALSPTVDFSFSAQFKDMKYPGSEYGRNGNQNQNTVNMDLNWQATPAMAVYGFFSRQEDSMQQKGLAQNACVLGTTYYFFSDGTVATASTRTPAQIAAGITVIGQSTPTAANFQALCGSASANSPLYLDTRAWTSDQKSINNTLGLGVRYNFPKARLDVSYNFTKGNTAVGYGYNAAAQGLTTSGAPTAAQLTTLGLIGTGFGDMTYKQHLLNMSLYVPLAKDISLRLVYLVELGSTRDWHYDGVAANPTPSNNMQTYLDSGPQPYRVQYFGAMVRMDF